MHKEREISAIPDIIHHNTQTQLLMNYEAGFYVIVKSFHVRCLDRPTQDTEYVSGRSWRNVTAGSWRAGLG